ncbi:MAG TPA: hypothetical protein VGX23_23215 [Actinocrinis sp.]|nr:hypothetical protein [Actinocrinis sp.]
MPQLISIRTTGRGRSGGRGGIRTTTYVKTRTITRPGPAVAPRVG